MLAAPVGAASDGRGLLPGCVRRRTYTPFRPSGGANTLLGHDRAEGRGGRGRAGVREWGDHAVPPAVFRRPAPLRHLRRSGAGGPRRPPLPRPFAVRDPAGIRAGSRGSRSPRHLRGRRVGAAGGGAGDRGPPGGVPGRILGGRLRALRPGGAAGDRELRRADGHADGRPAGGVRRAGGRGRAPFGRSGGSSGSGGEAQLPLPLRPRLRRLPQPVEHGGHPGGAAGRGDRAGRPGGDRLLQRRPRLPVDPGAHRPARRRAAGAGGGPGPDPERPGGGREPAGRLAASHRRGAGGRPAGAERVAGRGGAHLAQPGCRHLAGGLHRPGSSPGV